MFKKIMSAFSLLMVMQSYSQNYELVSDLNMDGSNYFGSRSNIQEIVEFNSKLYFPATTSNQDDELCSFNGVDSVMVIDIYTGYANSLNPNRSKPRKLTVSNGNLYFLAIDGTIGDSVKLFKYDGVNPPTEIDIINASFSQSNSIKIHSFNNKLYYNKINQITSEYELWEYDGTSSIKLTVPVSQAPTNQYGLFFNFNNKMYFTSLNTGNLLYEFDGNIITVAPNLNGLFSSVTNYAVFNNNLYLSLQDSPLLLGNELYKYDGVNTPTLISDINPGNQSSNAARFKVFNNKLYFGALFSSTDAELHCMDVSENITRIDLNPNGPAYPRSIEVYNNKLYISSTAGGDIHLFEYDGLNLPDSITNWGNSGYILNSFNLITFQNKLYFTADNSKVSNELHSYDGNQIELAANVNESTQGSNIRFITKFNGQLYFGATINKDVELYTYNGNNISLVANIDTAISTNGTPYGSNPQSFFEFNNTLYFSARTQASGSKIYKYDGVNPPSIDTNLSGGSNFYEWNNMLYFGGRDSNNDYELMVYDGVSSPTLVGNINPQGDSYPSNFTVVNNVLYFSAPDSTHGEELWMYDGTNPPSLVSNIHPGTEGSYPSGLIEYKNKLYFTAWIDTIVGEEMMVYDGVNPPSIVVDLFPGIDVSGYANSGYPYSYTKMGNLLYFVATHTDYSQQLYSYDGLSSPIKLTSHTNISGNNQFSKLESIYDKLYFWFNEDLGEGDELYIYDSINGLNIVPELRSGLGNSRPTIPSNFIEYNNYVYFAASDGLTGGSTGSEFYRISLCESATISANGNILSINQTGTSYQWIDCNNNNTPISGAINQTYTATTSGNYAVIVTRTGGCQTTSNCISVSTTDIDVKSLNNSVLVYPNPVNSIINIESEYSIKSVEVVNLRGKTVSLINDYKNINVDNLPSGTYFLKITSDNEFVVKRFIKL